MTKTNQATLTISGFWQRRIWVRPLIALVVLAVNLSTVAVTNTPNSADLSVTVVVARQEVTL